jgi:clan AA aspartic protease
MTGSVQNLHALMPVVIRLPQQPDLSLEFVVDTGFTGFLAIPAAAVAAMAFPFLHRIPASLADGSSVEIPVHAATILWNDAELTIEVLATGPRPLLGTALLDGNEFLAQFSEGGSVTIDAL